MFLSGVLGRRGRHRLGQRVRARRRGSRRRTGRRPRWRRGSRLPGDRRLAGPGAQADRLGRRVRGASAAGAGAVPVGRLHQLELSSAGEDETGQG